VAHTERSHDSLHVGALAAAVSIAFFRNFYAQGAILLYGDAVAHMHIARRVFDSITPGPLQLGTVWLPLPHVLMIPFVISDWMWRTGVGGSIVSMIAYIAGAVGIFRLVRAPTSRSAAWIAVAIYALNPNLIYLQTTALTEPLYLALFIWMLVLLDRALRGAEQIVERARSLQRAGILLAAAMLTRYDGWWLAGCALASAFIVSTFMLLQRTSAVCEFFSGSRYRPLRRALRNAVLVLAAVPALWLAYNYRQYGNPLEFATGPYSARGIEQRTAAQGQRHPGDSSPRVATLYLLKSAELNLGYGRWQWLLLTAAALGLVFSFASFRRFAVWWLLWLPLPFYMLAIAYGGVPLFIPVWWPFSYYNVRYGIEMLPAIAVFAALTFEVLRRASYGRTWRWALAALLIAVLAGSYVSVWRATPITIQEAVANSRTRIAYERALADALRRLPRAARLLMYTGAHPGALQLADIPLYRVVNESNYPQWEQALHNPALVDYVVAADDDSVARAATAHRDTLIPLTIIESSDQPRTMIYKTQPVTEP
jgi:4-amino-4-deoxy-L-arabinose transferase-like glycosyltransferase